MQGDRLRSDVRVRAWQAVIQDDAPGLATAILAQPDGDAEAVKLLCA